MLASGAHVRIGDKEFRLAFDIEGAYSYSLTNTGEETMLWLFDDWSGGEGNDAYDPLDEIVYHRGRCNPRIPGTLTSPPARESVQTNALTPTPNRAFHVAVGGRLYVIGQQVSGGSTTYWYTSDFTTLSAHTDSGWNSAVDYISAVASDGVNAYLLGTDVATGDYQIRTFAAGTTSGATNIRFFADANAYPIVSMCVFGDYLYTWNGNTLRERKISTGTSATDVVVKKLGNDLSGLTWGQDWWGSVIPAEDSLFFFFSTEGRTTVYERQSTGATAEVWNLPSGFTGKDIVYQNGALIVVGDYLNDTAVFGMSTVSRQPIFLGFVRLGSDISLEVLGTGFGSEILLSEASTAAGNGRVFVYDIGFDAFSELDQVTHASGRVWTAGTFRDKRFVCLEDGSRLSIYTWSQDDTPSTTVPGRMETGAWDFDLPEDEKQLDGFHVTSDAGGGREVDVYYQVDEGGTWTLAGTVTSGFHNYLPVSTGTTTVKFRTLRYRVDTRGGARVFSVSARARVNTYEEVWELLLDLSDERLSSSHPRRRRTHEDRGWQLRDYIRSIAKEKRVVTFLDGARYPQRDKDDPDKYSTHTVVVDIPLDRLEQPEGGPMLVRLRSVDVN